MDITNIIKHHLYDRVMTDGKLSERENVLNAGTNDNFDDKVEIPVHGTKIKMISLASNDVEFSDVNADNIRIGFQNANKQWSNLFIDEVPSDILMEMSYYFSIPNASTR